VLHFDRGLRLLRATEIVIDSHCHLADEKFRDDLEQVVARAKAAGLVGALVILEGGNAAEAEQAVEVERLWPEVRTAIGVHPHISHEYAADPERAAAIVAGALDATPSARAVGEIGLDYHYDFSPRDVQQAVFRVQLRVARERQLPVVIHTREAEADTLAIIGECGSDTSGVFHCFSGDVEVAARALATGYYLSIPGIVSFPKAVALREAVRIAPLDRLLIETDSPYLAPVPFRGKRNEPAHVARVAEVLAETRGLAPAELSGAVTANTRRLFRF
jgi:TatD DNase family protein